MSPTNAELWRGALERLAAAASPAERDAWSKGETEIWDPDIVFDTSEIRLPDFGGVHRGVDALRSFWSEWFAAWETLEFDYELVDAGDRVVLLVEDQRMRGRASGVEVSLPKYAHVAVFKDGAMVYWKIYNSQSKALEAAGLPGSRAAGGPG